MNTRSERGRSQRVEQGPAVVRKDADIFQVPPGDLGDQPGDAILEYLATDKPDLGMRRGLRREVLAGAEPNLEPYRVRPLGEQRGRIEHPGFG